MLNNKMENNFRVGKQGLVARLHEVVTSIISAVGGIVSSIGDFLAIPVTVAGTQIGTIGSLLNFVLHIATTIYSVCSGASGKQETYHSLDENGQLVNTRQSNDPIRVVYGMAKTGGTWIYNKSSARSNTVLNTIITWSEGELSGLGTAIDSSVIFSGTTTLNDLETSGTFTAPTA